MPEDHNNLPAGTGIAAVVGAGLGTPVGVLLGRRRRRAP